MSDDPLQIEWLIEGRLMRFQGTADRDVISQRNQMILEALEEHGQPPMVHCLIDHRNQYTEEEVESQPRRALDYIPENDEVRQKLLAHRLLGWIISIATPNVGLKLAATVTSQKDQYRWRSVDTLEEALHWLQQVDVTLPNLSELGIE